MLQLKRAPSTTLEKETRHEKYFDPHPHPRRDRTDRRLRLPAPAAAQDAYKGSFTLTEDVRWSQAMLPAGEYTFSLKSATVPAQIILHGPNGSAIVMTSATDTKNSEAPSSITVKRFGGMRVVRDLSSSRVGHRSFLCRTQAPP